MWRWIMSYSILMEAKAVRTMFIQATLDESNLTGVDLSRTTLRHANFYKADLTQINLNKSTLVKTTLDLARMVDTKLDQAILEDCSVYGVAAWYDGEPKRQKNLRITSPYDHDVLAGD